MPLYEIPMFAELRGHQGTTGNPYPNRVMYFMLGYGMLYNGAKAKAKEFFTRSLTLNPDNTKCRLELELL